METCCVKTKYRLHVYQCMTAVYDKSYNSFIFFKYYLITSMLIVNVKFTLFLRYAIFVLRCHWLVLL